MASVASKIYFETKIGMRMRCSVVNDVRDSRYLGLVERRGVADIVGFGRVG